MKPRFIFVSIALTLSIDAGCAPPHAVATPSVSAALPQSEVPQIVPLKRGELPQGWRFNGLAGTVIQFVKVDSDAAINFHVFSSQAWTAESVIRRLADQGASKPGVTISGIFVVKGGNEAGLSIRDDRIGMKRGRAVARTFPGRSTLGVLVVGLWPADKDAETIRDFNKLLDWVRMD